MDSITCLQGPEPKEKTKNKGVGCVCVGVFVDNFSVPNSIAKWVPVLDFVGP